MRMFKVDENSMLIVRKGNLTVKKYLKVVGIGVYGAKDLVVRGKVVFNCLVAKAMVDDFLMNSLKGEQFQ